jgi:hypothetical protein
MAENIPNIPGGAVPPKKETGKVQPKKETVRINLPPKPSAAPTIKLPTLPPGGPTGAAPSPAAPPSTHAPAPAAPPPTRSTAAPIAQRQAPTAAPQQRPVAAAPVVVSGLSPVDTVLAIVAAVVGLAAVGSTVWVMMMIH